MTLFLNNISILCQGDHDFGRCSCSNLARASVLPHQSHPSSQVPSKITASLQTRRVNCRYSVVLTWHLDADDVNRPPCAVRSPQTTRGAYRARRVPRRLAGAGFLPPVAEQRARRGGRERREERAKVTAWSRGRALPALLELYPSGTHRGDRLYSVGDGDGKEPAPTSSSQGPTWHKMW
jgi:hypothetical protein